MKYEWRTRQDGGGGYYSLVTADHKRLSKQEIRDRFGKDLLTLEDAKQAIKLLGASDELKKFRIKKRLDWEKEFYSFKGLLDQYTQVQKKRAPNSWKNNVHYLKYYVLHYFLQIAKLNVIELWSENYSKFTEWLETAKTLDGKKEISFASKNHAIKALNTFLEQLYREKIITNFQKCPTFGEHLLHERGLDDVISPEEMEKVYSQLIQDKFKIDAVFFRFLFFTGMRFNEGLAISLGDLFSETIENEFMQNKLTAYKIDYYGYLVAEGQFEKIDSNDHVIRAPFKGKKKIHEKFNRIVPIIDKVLWNDLCDLSDVLTGTQKNEKDILLFKEIDDATFSRRCKNAFESLKLRYRSPHCLRHSRATLLIGQTADVMLARIWLGHSSPRTIEKYNHVYAQITRAAKLKTGANGSRLKRAK